MQRKYKVTYLQYGAVKAVILETNLTCIIGDLINEGCSEGDIIRIEVVLEALPEDIIDRTV